MPEIEVSDSQAAWPLKKRFTRIPQFYGSGKLAHAFTFPEMFPLAVIDVPSWCRSL
jgi:hypothetical protein